MIETNPLRRMLMCFPWFTLRSGEMRSRRSHSMCECICKQGKFAPIDLPQLTTTQQRQWRLLSITHNSHHSQCGARVSMKVISYKHIQLSQWDEENGWKFADVFLLSFVCSSFFLVLLCSHHELINILCCFVASLSIFFKASSPSLCDV